MLVSCNILISCNVDKKVWPMKGICETYLILMLFIRVQYHPTNQNIMLISELNYTTARHYKHLTLRITDSLTAQRQKLQNSEITIQGITYKIDTRVTEHNHVASVRMV